MRAIIMTGWLLASLVCLPSLALADWSETFDLYVPNSELTGQGGWEAWGFGAGALVSDDVSRSPEHSVAIAAASDMVHQYAGYTTGKWLYKTYVYVPSDMVGLSYFILLNTYAPPTYAWSVQFGFDASDGMIHADLGLSPGDVITVPFVTDEWAEIRCYIDLDNDWVQIFYNGVLLDDPALDDHPTLGGGYPWTEGVFGGETNALNIGAVDLFANNASNVYYDDMSLSPAEAWVDVAVDLDSGTRIDYAIVAGEDMGTIDVDAWVVLLTPNGPFSYDGSGPTMGWNSGLGNTIYTGPLGNASGVSLDIPFPIPWSGNYTAVVALDTIPNGIPDVPDALLMEMLPFTQ